MEKCKYKVADFIGFFLLATGLLQYLSPLFYQNFAHFIWFSGHVVIILGVGFLVRSSFLITTEMSIALIPETLWSLDFLSRIISGRYLIGVTSYIFDNQPNFLTILNLEHLIIIPAGLFGLWYFGVSKNGWKGSLVHLSILWIIGVLAGPSYNLNCVYSSCIKALPNLGSYMILLPAFSFIAVIISNLLLLGISRLRKILHFREGYTSHLHMK